MASILKRGRFSVSLALFVLLAVGPSVALATALAYQYEAPDGSVVFTDKALTPPFKLVKRLKLTWGQQKLVPKPKLDASNSIRNRELYAPLINEAAAEHRLLPELLHAVIEAESAYDATAVSPAGAVGLMQLMPATAERFGVVHRTDPAQSIDGGAQYLRFLLDHFDNDLKLALAGYNAGENAVERYNRSIPPYPETQQYVVRVLKYLRRNLASPATSGVSQLTAMARP